jgi:hypothetical protein
VKSKSSFILRPVFKTAQEFCTNVVANQMLACFEAGIFGLLAALYLGPFFSYK